MAGPRTSYTYHDPSCDLSNIRVKYIRVQYTNIQINVYYSFGPKSFFPMQCLAEGMREASGYQPILLSNFLKPVSQN